MGYQEAAGGVRRGREWAEERGAWGLHWMMSRALCCPVGRSSEAPSKAYSKVLCRASSEHRTWALCSQVGASSHPKPAPLLWGWDPLPMNRNPQCTKEQALENGCVFFYRLLFCWGLGFGRERKANFIFLTINLLSLVLFHFYNYTLRPWHLCKIIPANWAGSENKQMLQVVAGVGAAEEGWDGEGESVGRLCNWITTELNNGFHEPRVLLIIRPVKF